MSGEPQMQEQSYALAEHWLMVGQPQRTLEALEGADVEDARTWRLRAAALHHLDQHEQTADAAQAGLQIDPEDPYLLRLLAAARREEGDLAAAERAVLLGLRTDTEDVGLLCEYTRILMDGGQLPKAKEVIARAVRAGGPDNIETLACRAQIAWIEGRRADGVQDVERILELDPENPYAQSMLGAFKSERAWPTTWARHAEAAVREDPSDPVLVEVAREARLATHPAMIPLWPVERFGWIGVTIAGIVTVNVVRATVGGPVGGVVALLWLTFCVYSWVAPALLRRWLTRRWR